MPGGGGGSGTSAGSALSAVTATRETISIGRRTHSTKPPARHDSSALLPRGTFAAERVLGDTAAHEETARRLRPCAGVPERARGRFITPPPPRGTEGPGRP